MQRQLLEFIGSYLKKWHNLQILIQMHVHAQIITGTISGTGTATSADIVTVTTAIIDLVVMPFVGFGA
jgi:hypothetical protein